MLLALAYVLVLAIVALEVPLGSSVADRVDAEVRSQARAEADIVAALASDVEPVEARGLERLVDAAAENVRGRVIVVDGRGQLLADSEGAPPGRSYGQRPEIAAALEGQADQRERTSETLDETLLATAVPVIRDGRPDGAVRVTQSVEAVDRAVRRAWGGLVLIGLLVLGLGLLVGSIVATQIARPLGRLADAARSVGEGDLAARARIEGSTEQQSLARTFNETAERLERLVNSQREFVADASHQLRTPLTGLRLRIEAAASEAPDPNVRAELDAAIVELDRLAAIVRELLELSRAGERDMNAEPVPLRSAIQRAAARWDAAAREKRQRIISEPDGDGSVRMSRADLDRILDALIENALQYSEEGASVTVSAVHDGIEVRDQGNGLRPGEEEEVFGRFHRGSAGRQGPAGTGLGLPIARELARRWGGDVTLRNAAGGGAVAELRLPEA